MGGYATKRLSISTKYLIEFLFLICSELTPRVNLGHRELDRDYGKLRFFRKDNPKCLDTGLETGITR